MALPSVIRNLTFERRRIRLCTVFRQHMCFIFVQLCHLYIMKLWLCSNECSCAAVVILNALQSSLCRVFGSGQVSSQDCVFNIFGHNNARSNATNNILLNTYNLESQFKYETNLFNHIHLLTLLVPSVLRLAYCDRHWLRRNTTQLTTRTILNVNFDN